MNPTADELRAAGTSAEAIRHHYDISDEFFGLWLGADLVYSCALWDAADPADTLESAQRRKLDYFANHLGVRGGRVLDVGCGWGALLDRFATAQGANGGVGLTLSPAQAAFAQTRGVPGVAYRVESWVDHEPDDAYDAITAIESTEHFASDRLDPDEKVDVYRAFFERAASWLRPGGKVGLQLICLDNLGHAGSRPGRGPFADLLLADIFPESMPASLSELVLGWETHFELDEFHDHHDHYRKTFRAWNLAYRRHEDDAGALIGADRSRVFGRYFAAGEAAFRLREHSLYRVILTRRPEPKSWAVEVRPSALDAAVPAGGASAAAVTSHYDVSNDFYRLWLGPSMMYSSGHWDNTSDLDSALDAKIDYFAGQVLAAPSARVLDVGCGWGGNLRRLLEHHDVESAVGLTVSPAQRDFVTAHPIIGAEVRLEPWEEHTPAASYDAIFSYGAFEHFARDGSTGPDRIAAYREFFRACFEWLRPGGGLALETITHDSAPDTAQPLGRGPLGDFVLELYPESLAPHLSEIVLGFEPWFEVEALRADGADFARTMRAWQVALREREAEAAKLVGAETARRFQRYLAASEFQFRTRVLTNTRLVLRRRPAVRH